jgi:WD40 repeat protein
MISLAAQRRKNPPELAAAVRGDLDAILSKALAADRGNRYRSVADLASDVRLHLENRPVSVTNAGWIVRSRKFVRRHAVSLAVAGVTSGILLAALCATLVEGLRSRKLERDVIRHAAEAVNANKKQVEMRSQKLVLLGLDAIRHQELGEAMAWFSQAARLAAPGSPECKLHQQRVHALAASAVLPIRVLQPKGPLRLLEFSPDGSQLLALAGDGGCIVWNWQADQVPQWSEKLGAVTAAQWRPAGTQVALGFASGAVEIRDTANGAVVRRLEFGEGVKAIRFSPDGQELAVAGKTLRLWEERRGEWSAWQWEHPAPIFAIRYSADAKRLVSACDDHQARVFLVNGSEPDSSRLLNVFRHETGVTGFNADHCAAALIPTDPLPPLFLGAGNRLLTWSAMNELTVWDPAQNWSAGKINGTCLATRVRASPNGEWIAVTFPEGSARLWSPESFPGLVAARLKHQERICDLAFGSQAKWVLTASADRTAKLWQLPDGKPILSPLMHSSEVAHGAVSRNGKWIATAQSDGQIRVWRLPPPQGDVKPIALGLPGRWTAQASPGGRQILLSAQNAESKTQQAVLLHGDGFQYEPSPLDLSGEFVAGAWTSDGDRLAILTRRNGNDSPLSSGQLEIWRVEDLSAPLQRIELPFVPVQFAVAPDGRCFAIADGQGGVWMADPNSRPRLTLWIPPVQQRKESDQEMVFSASGKSLIGCGTPGQIEVWDATSHQRRFVLEASTPGASRRRITPSPNESHLLVTEPDGTSRVINLKDGRVLGNALPHPGGVVAQGFSPDGRWVVTSGHDGCVRINDWRTGEMVCPPLVHADEVFGFDFSTNGNWLATACRDGTFRVWDTKIGASLLSAVSVNEPLVGVKLSADNRWAILMGRGSTVWNCRLHLQQETNDWSAEELTMLSETVSCLTIEHDQPANLGSADWQERLTRIRTLRPGYFLP